MKIKLHAELIFMRKVSHLDSFWNIDTCKRTRKWLIREGGKAGRQNHPLPSPLSWRSGSATDSYQHQMSKANFEFIRNTWNYWWWNYTRACTFSLNFEICVLEFPWKIVFDVISVNYLYLKLLENAKGTGRLKLLFWYKVFIHSKLKFLDFLQNFILTVFACILTNWANFRGNLIYYLNCSGYEPS